MSGTIIRNGTRPTRRVLRIARAAALDAVVAKRALKDGESYRTIAAAEGVGVASVHRSVQRLWKERSEQAEVVFGDQARLTVCMIQALTKPALAGDMMASRELRHWVGLQSRLFGTLAPMRVNAEVAPSTNVRVAACLETLPLSVVRELTELPAEQLVSRVMALTGISLTLPRELLEADAGRRTEFTGAGNDPN